MVARSLCVAMAGIAMTVLGVNQAMASSCLTREEAKGHQLRVLQTQLMVGALQCRGESAAGQRSYYNSFVQRYGPELLAGHRSLEGYFRRQFGAAYQSRLDSHITSIANLVSLESQKVDDFCGQIAALGAVLTDGADADLWTASLAAPVAQIHEPVSGCFDDTAFGETATAE